MPSSNSDHNYYTLEQHSRHPSLQSNQDQFQHTDDVERIHSGPAPSSSAEQLLTLPAYTYSQPLQTPPKRPSISTDFENYALEARLNGFTSGPPNEDNSPDPHDFYQPFRDPFTETRPGHRDIIVLGKGEGMTTSTYQRKPNPAATRANGTAPKQVPLHPRSGARPRPHNPSPTSGNSSPLNAAKSSPNLSGVARNRQTSLRDLVDKFNGTPNEKPLLPSKPGAESTSATLNPASRAQNNVRTRTPLHSTTPGGGDTTHNSRLVRDKPRDPTRSTPRRDGFADAVRSPPRHTPGRTTPSNRPPLSGNASAAHSMTELPQVPLSKDIFKPRLFGEILSVDTSSPDPGYGIPSPRRRRGSEGSMHSPNPMFPHNLSDGDSGLSPSSPTAWYLGYTPSLDSVRSDRPGMHRRARSDFQANTSKPVTASALGMHVATISQLQETPTASKTPSGSQRNSQSRIPVSNRRMSATSDSGNSVRSSRANSALGRTPMNKGHAKGTSALPRPRRISISPARNWRESSSRSSPRRQNHSPPAHHLRTSPLLKAYISAPLPKKSPPLRSSRPRQPVSSASTAASRAKAAERLATTKDSLRKDSKEAKARKLPELGGVDFAARRQRIQQAFAKSVQENEKKEVIKAERRRAAEQKENEETQVRKASEAQEIAEVNHTDDAEGHVVDQLNYSDDRDVPDQNHAENTTEALVPTERHLTLNTGSVQRSFSNAQSSFSHVDATKASTLDHDDSPTLGVPGDFSGIQLIADRSGTPGSDCAPLSAVTAGTAETEDTVIDNEPQSDSPELNLNHGTILHQVMRMRASSPASPSRSELGDDSSCDKDDRESIPIMLFSTPTVGALGDSIDDEHPEEELRGVLPNDEHQEGELRGVFSNEGPSDRWSMDSWTSSVPDRPFPEHVQDAPMERIDEYSPPLPAESSHLSFSTTVDSDTPQPWSPTEFSTPRTARTTLDSETYSTINHILEHYHDPDLLSPQMMQDFQQQLLVQSPELARQGGWDPRRVTQLYLQELTRGGLTSGSAVPVPLNPGLRRPFEAPSTPNGPRLTEIIKTPNGVPENTRQDAEGGRESSADGGSSNQPSLEVEPSRLNPQRASLNHPDDWAHTSPSILDWIHPQARDSPVDERRGSGYCPTPPPKERRSVSPGPEFPDPVPTGSDQDLVRREDTQPPRLSFDSGPRLPGIFGTGELGLPNHISSPQDAGPSTLGPIPPLPDYSPPLPPTVPLISEVIKQDTSMQLPASPSTHEKFSQFQSAVYSEATATRPSARNSDASSQQRSVPTTSAQASGSSRSHEQGGGDRPSVLSENATPPTPEQKRLIKRRHIVKELVDTEYSYCSDMKVLEDIYRGSCPCCVQLSSEDVRVLFGNSDQIVAFSTEFLDGLKQAAKSIYVMPKSCRWRAKRGSGSTSNTGDTDDQASLNGTDLTDDEKDRMTSIGETFVQYMVEIERVYAEYLRNHDAANKKLQVLLRSEIVVLWLNECRSWAADLTSAWDLDSLLVKPVQRILKYPLLLGQLLEVTPEDHPDYTSLDIAVREMMGASHRINEMKRRAELVEQVVNRRKRKESDVRTGLSKAFGRRTEKLRQQVGLSELYEDKEYNLLSDQFGTHFMQLQLVVRDFEQHTRDLQQFADKFNEIVVAIEGCIDVGPTSHPELESKWRKFRMSMREVSATALSDHITAIRKGVIEPITALLKLQEGPQRFMQKRKKRLLDYAKFRAIKERGEKPDKKTREQGDLFIALNDTFKDEIPKLFSLTNKMVRACFNSFVQLEAQWYTVWRRKLSAVLDSYSVAEHISQIVDQFHSDFAYPEANVLSLGICNGSMTNDTVNLLGFISPLATLVGDDSSSVGKSVRSLNVRHRGLSLNSDVSPSLPQPDFGLRHSGSFTFSPLAEYAPQLPSIPLYGPNQLSTNGRMRAGSGFSNRDPTTPDMSGGTRYHSANTPASFDAARPSTAQARSTHPSPSLPRLSVDTPAFTLSSSNSSGETRRASDSTHFSATQDKHVRAPSPGVHYSSSLFSSALPMSDSPPPQTPAEGDSPRELNIMFLVASVYEFKVNNTRMEAKYPYLTYRPGEIFDVVGAKGDCWLAKNQDDPTNTVGWIWAKHFMRLEL